MRLSALALCLGLLWPSASLAQPVQGVFSATAQDFGQIEHWAQDHQGEALEAFQRSCTKLRNISADANIGTGIFMEKAAIWHGICRAAESIAPADSVGARQFFEQHFTPMALAYNGNPNGKFTGYYEPMMQGAWERKDVFQTPVYGRPDDLPRDGGMYHLTRRDIENGALAGKGLELMYIDNPVDVFFLHVQGSGRVMMDTGEVVALRFNGKNNQPYTAIGKVMADKGYLQRDAVSAPAIRSWLRNNPDEARAIMQHNDSFVFFSVETELGGGPVGAQNVPLIPERSLAVDTSFIPLGMPLWLDTRLPASPEGRAQRYQRLMVAQDKGSAILGAIRGDIFFGFGDRAADLAGHMNSEGRFIALVPKSTAARISKGAGQ